MQRLLNRSVLTRFSCRTMSTQSTEVQNRLGNMVKENSIVVFMKGTPVQPMCGFSKAVCQILDIHEIGEKYISTHNVLEDDDIREGIKIFSSWPTIPQVFMAGEFIGGCDIMLDMHKSGELITELKKLGIKSALEDEV